MTRADVGSALAVVLLLAVAVAADRGARLGQARQVLVAGLRAVVQLAVVGVVVAAVFSSPALAPLYLAVVLAAASWTSARRLGRRGELVAVAAAALGGGAASGGGGVVARGGRTQ